MASVKRLRVVVVKNIDTMAVIFKRYFELAQTVTVKQISVCLNQ